MYETLSLMDYLREYHAEPIEWFCDDDACAASRQLERENGQDTKRTVKARERKFTITQAPEILSIQLKRSQGVMSKGRFREVKVYDDVPYLEELDLSNFTTYQRPLKYRLYAVVAHRGSSATSGHYIAAVRRKDQGFMTISDLRMQEDEAGTPEELLNPSFDDEKFDPVLLFYLRV